MPTSLPIDSSPLYDRAVSRNLNAAFATQWNAFLAHAQTVPGGHA